MSSKKTFEQANFSRVDKLFMAFISNGEVQEISREKWKEKSCVSFCNLLFKEAN